MFSHLDAAGEARMVDVSLKAPSQRTAAAECAVLMNSETLHLLRSGTLKKGDAFTTAKIAAIQAAKRTFEIIPLCHPLALEHIDIVFQNLPEQKGVRIESRVKTTSKTGVEIEALHAVLIAALTLYDMAKSYDPAMSITHARLVQKTGGKSDYSFEGGRSHGK